MGLFDSAFDMLGLGPDLSGAINTAAYNPYNVQTSYGGLTYDDQNRTFTSALSPELQGIQSGLFSQYGQVNPNQQLDLFRQQAAPYNEAQYLDMENRLFSQGRLGHSQVYNPGGQMRGLFDAQANQDLQFQLMAQQQAQQAQQNYLNQILGISNMENSLFNASMGQGQIGMQGQLQQSQLQAQQDAFMPNAIWGLGGAALGGWASSGFA